MKTGLIKTSGRTGRTGFPLSVLEYTEVYKLYTLYKTVVWKPANRVDVFELLKIFIICDSVTSQISEKVFIDYLSLLILPLQDKFSLLEKSVPYL